MLQFDWLIYQCVLMVFNGKKMVYTDEKTRQCPPYCFFHSAPKYFACTVKSMHRTIKILTFSDSAGKTTSITYIEVVYS